MFWLKKVLNKQVLIQILMPQMTLLKWKREKLFLIPSQFQMDMKWLQLRLIMVKEFRQQQVVLILEICQTFQIQKAKQLLWHQHSQKRDLLWQSKLNELKKQSLWVGKILRQVWLQALMTMTQLLVRAKTQSPHMLGKVLIF